MLKCIIKRVIKRKYFVKSIKRNHCKKCTKPVVVQVKGTYCIKGKTHRNKGKPTNVTRVKGNHFKKAKNAHCVYRKSPFSRRKKVPPFKSQIMLI